MNTSFPKNVDLIEDIVVEIFNLNREEIAMIECISGGRNSKVYQMTSVNGSKDIIKQYFSQEKDKRNRLKVEFESLKILEGQGIKNIPRAIDLNRGKNIGLYQYIYGKKIAGNEIKVGDIDLSTTFLLELYKLRTLEEAKKIPWASDACFSFKSMEMIIEHRLSKLLSLDQSSPKNEKLISFLTSRFKPLYNEIVQWCKEYAQEKEFKWDVEFPLHSRTLSPSDFGFHNALKQIDGKIIFYDFEYFGWDDSTKMIIDFIQHPGMDLSDECKERFVQNMINGLKVDQTLSYRLKISYPLISLVWCLIVLNEFIPEYFQRRIFSEKINPPEPKEIEEKILSGQLSKAEQILKEIAEKYKNFPYGAIKQKSTLDERSKKLRGIMIKVFEKGKRGHLPSALSIVEILRVLYDDIMNYNPQKTKWDERDRFILSKGHGCIALYTLLAEKGFFQEKELWDFCKIDGILGGHPECKIPGVELATGSLGHGLPVGVGMALNGKIENQTYRVFVVLGDGECNEGSIWEAAMSASKHKLDNLVVIIDYNKQMTYGTTHEVQDLEPFAEKWKSFGFAVKEVDVHNVEELKNVFQIGR